MNYTLTIYRQTTRGKKNPYTVITNRTHQDTRLSFAARGLLGYMLSRKSGWDLTDEELAENRLGREAYKALMKELVKAGYVIVPQQQRDSLGRYQQKAEMIVRETPELSIDLMEAVEGERTPEAPTDIPSAVDGLPANGSSADGQPAGIQNNKESQIISDQITRQSEENSGADDDDLHRSIFRGCFRDYEQKHGAMPVTLEAPLMQEAQRLGVTKLREVMERGIPKENAWGYLLAKLVNEPTPTMPAPLPPPVPCPPSPTEKTPEEIEAERVQREVAAAEALQRKQRLESPEGQNWKIAYSQLELQLDRASFDTWLRGAEFLRVDDGVYIIGVRNSYARDMLQHRLYRSIVRVLGDVIGINQPAVCFEIVEPRAHLEQLDDMPLFKVLAMEQGVQA